MVDQLDRHVTKTEQRPEIDKKIQNHKFYSGTFEQSLKYGGEKVIKHN